MEQEIESEDHFEAEEGTILYDASYDCLVLFEAIIEQERSTEQNDETSLDEEGHDSLKSQYNSFLLWVDYTGALSLQKSSLDFRLRCYSDISTMVLELLEMVARNLRRLTTLEKDDLPSRHKNIEKAVEDALERLHFLATAIRKASAKRMQFDVSSFLKDEDTLFRRDIIAYVKWKFPTARRALCAQLGDSIAVRRRMLVQKQQHAQKLATRRTRPTKSSEPEVASKRVQDTSYAPDRTETLPARPRIDPVAPSTVGTKASRPPRQALIMEHLKPRPRPTLSSVRSTVSVKTEDIVVQYPSPPTVQAGQKRTPCPYCLTPLESSRLREANKNYWIRHVDQDLQPYVCLFPQCATALVFFNRQQEWRDHMDSVHGANWPREVHSTTYYCDISHEKPLQFQDEDDWRKHMGDLEAHAARFSKPPSKAQLDVLALRKCETVLRDPWVCPLCEDIPEDMGPLISKLNPEDLDSKLIRHIAQHIKSLSLMSLPGANEDQEEEKQSSIDEKASLKRIAKTDSAQLTPSQPSGIERLSESSLLVKDNGLFEKEYYYMGSTNFSLQFDDLEIAEDWGAIPSPPDPLNRFIPNAETRETMEAIWTDILNSKGSLDYSDPIILHLNEWVGQAGAASASPIEGEARAVPKLSAVTEDDVYRSSLRYCDEVLATDDMYQRFNEIYVVEDETCEWLINGRIYKRWASLEGEGDLILIGGQAAGKSTLLKYLVQSHAAANSKTICLSHFFPPPNQGPKGLDFMLRHLLFQLLPFVPEYTQELENAFKDKMKRGVDLGVALDYDLPRYFYRALKSIPHDNRVMLVVDTSDPSDFSIVQAVVSWMERLRKQAGGTSRFKICLSIRASSISDMPAELSGTLRVLNHVKMESFSKESVHQYVSGELRYLLDDALSAVKSEFIRLIVDISDGNFFLAEVATRRLLDMRRQARSLDYAKRTLENMPKHLDPLMRWMLDTIDPQDRDECSTLLGWLIFSKRHLADFELEWAMEAMGVGTYVNLARYSCGLATTRVLKTNFLRDDYVVVFKYEGIRDALLAGAIQDITITKPDLSVQMTSHLNLAKACILSLKEAIEVPGTWASDKRVMDFHFLKYAANSLLYHLEGSGTVLPGSEEAQTIAILLYTYFVESWVSVCEALGFDICAVGAEYPIKNTRPIHILARAGMLEYWIANRISLDDHVNVRDNCGWTALTWAAYRGHVGIIPGIVSLGGELNAGDEFLRTPIFWAVMAKKDDAIRLLVELGATVDFRNDSNETPLFCAAVNGHVRQMQTLIELGADIHARKDGGVTSLMAAAWKGHHPVAKLLLDSGARINDREIMGRSVLYFAVSYAQDRLATFLIERGADVNAVDQHGRSVLIEAVVRQHVDAVKVLLDADVDVSLRCESGRSALDEAKESGNTKILKMLLEYEK